jgi:heme A synthase
MPEVHLVVGCFVILLNLAAFAVGGVAWFRNRPSIPFWYLLRAAQVSVFLQVALGGLLVFTNHKPGDNLHYLYGLLPLLVSFLAEGARTGAAQRELGDTQESIALQIVRREMGIMTVSCGVILFLALRAATTSGHTFF